MMGTAFFLINPKKDIVFLDVEMSGFDGIYVGNELKSRMNPLLFL